MLSYGEHYYNVRHLERKGDTVSALSYMDELSDPTRLALKRALNTLSRHEMFRNALDEVMEFEGLRSGLEITHFAKIFACNCDDMATFFLKGITKAWNCMSLGKKGSVDEVTVRNFETLAPCANRADRDVVTSLMDAGIAFSEVRDPITRSKMKTRIFKLRRVIPSLATFHRNMNYIRIAAKILRTHLDMPQELFHTTQTTLKERLADGWPHGQRPLVEVEEGVFLPLIGESSSQIAFQQLFLSVLRNFPYLSFEQPLRDIRSEPMYAAPDTRQLYVLFQRASKLGFSNEKIKKGLLQPHHSMDGFQIPSFQPRIEVNEPISDWRCGKPYVRSFFALRKISFLPDLGKCNTFIEGPTVEFVYQDLITAFFGEQEVVPDHTVPRIFIDGRVPSIQHFPAVQDGDAEANAQMAVATKAYAPDIEMAMGTEDIESDAYMSGVAREIERVPESPTARTKKLERLALQRRAGKKALEKFQGTTNLRHSEDPVSLAGRNRWKAQLSPALDKAARTTSKQKERLTKASSLISRGMNRHTWFGNQRQEIPPVLAPLSASADDDPPQSLTLPGPIESPDGVYENSTLVIHPENTNGEWNYGNDISPAIWPDTPGLRNATQFPALPHPALIEAENNQMAIQHYVAQHRTARIAPPIPRPSDKPTEVDQMAIQHYVAQHRTARIAPPIPCPSDEPTEADQMAIQPYIPQQGYIPVSARVSSEAPENAVLSMPENPAIGTDASADGSELPQEPQVPVCHPGAEQSKLEFPDEHSHTSSRGSTWTDVSPIVDRFEASLRQNASIGQLIPAEYDERPSESIPAEYDERSEPIPAEHDESNGELIPLQPIASIDEFTPIDHTKRKRRRQSNLTDTEWRQEGEEEELQAKEAIHTVRKILPLKGTTRNAGRTQERYVQLKYMSHGARTENSHRSGEEILIRRAQSKRPRKRRWFGGAFIGTDQGTMEEVALTPAETLNTHLAPIYRGPQTRPPLPIPGTWSQG